MSFVSDSVRAVRTVLMLQEDVRVLKETAARQSGQLASLAEAHANLRDRVSRIEGLIEGVTIAARQRRIEE